MALDNSRFSGTGSIFVRLAQAKFAVWFWMRIALPVGLVVFLWRGLAAVEPLGHGGGVAYLQASLYELSLSAEKPAEFVLPKRFKNIAVARHPDYLEMMHIVNSRVMLAGATGGGAMLFILLVGGWAARRERLQQTSDQHRRGSELVSPKQLSKLLKKSEGKGEIELGEIILPWMAECRGIAAIGMTGAGKTQLQNRILDKIVERGDRGIIYSVKGDDYITTHWRDGDAIFCPADQRCVGWNLMDDVTDLADFDVIANSLVVHDDRVKTWSNGARMIVSGLLKYCWLFGHRTNRQVASVFDQDATGMRDYLRQVPGASQAAGLLADPTSAPANSFYITVCLFSRPFQLLKHLEGGWSISRWIKEGSGRIYLPATPRLREQLGGLYSVFYDLAIVHHLSLPKDPERRIWYCIDELSAVGQISRLPELRNVGRDKGAGAMVGLQSFPQLDPIYTPDGRKAMFGGFASKAIFRCDEQNTLDELSKQLGKQEVESSRENLSTSFNTEKDGVTKMAEVRDEILIKPDEIKTLQNLHFYLQVAGYPATQTKVEYRDWPHLIEAYIPHPALSLEALAVECARQNAQVSSLKTTSAEKPTAKPAAAVTAAAIIE